MDAKTKHYFNLYVFSGLYMALSTLICIGIGQSFPSADIWWMVAWFLILVANYFGSLLITWFEMRTETPGRKAPKMRDLFFISASVFVSYAVYLIGEVYGIYRQGFDASGPLFRRLYLNFTSLLPGMRSEWPYYIFVTLILFCIGVILKGRFWQAKADEVSCYDLMQASSLLEGPMHNPGMAETEPVAGEGADGKTLPCKASNGCHSGESHLLSCYKELVVCQQSRDTYKKDLDLSSNWTRLYADRIRSTLDKLRSLRSKAEDKPASWPSILGVTWITLLFLVLNGFLLAPDLGQATNIVRNGLFPKLPLLVWVIPFVFMLAMAASFGNIELKAAETVGKQKPAKEGREKEDKCREYYWYEGLDVASMCAVTFLTLVVVMALIWGRFETSSAAPLKKSVDLTAITAVFQARDIECLDDPKASRGRDKAPDWAHIPCRLSGQLADTPANSLIVVSIADATKPGALDQALALGVHQGETLNEGVKLQDQTYRIFVMAITAKPKPNSDSNVYSDPPCHCGARIDSKTYWPVDEMPFLVATGSLKPKDASTQGLPLAKGIWKQRWDFEGYQCRLYERLSDGKLSAPMACMPPK